MIENAVLSTNLEKKLDAFSNVVGSVFADVVVYVLPVAAGLYNGVIDGYGLDIQSDFKKYTILAMPTIVATGLTGVGLALSNYGIKISTDKELINRVKMKGATEEQAIETLKSLKNLNQKKLIGKGALKTSVITALGYAAGYGCTKFFNQF